MNERMLELAEQAWDATAVSPEFGHPVSFAEKLSKLIVQECIQVCGPEDSYTDEWLKAKADSVVKIKQHFGVEE